jgi:hypothetical protein
MVSLAIGRRALVLATVAYILPTMEDKLDNSRWPSSHPGSFPYRSSGLWQDSAREDVKRTKICVCGSAGLKLTRLDRAILNTTR